MTIAGETTLFNNQSILQNFAFGEEINEQAAEIISGGVERFTLKNDTQKAIIYTVDDVAWIIQPGEEHTVITDMGGKIRFDGDTRDITRIMVHLMVKSKQFHQMPLHRQKNQQKNQILITPVPELQYQVQFMK